MWSWHLGQELSCTKRPLQYLSTIESFAPLCSLQYWIELWRREFASLSLTAHIAPDLSRSLLVSSWSWSMMKEKYSWASCWNLLPKISSSGFLDPSMFFW